MPSPHQEPSDKSTESGLDNKAERGRERAANKERSEAASEINEGKLNKISQALPSEQKASGKSRATGFGKNADGTGGLPSAKSLFGNASEQESLRKDWQRESYQQKFGESPDSPVGKTAASESKISETADRNLQLDASMLFAKTRYVPAGSPIESRGREYKLGDLVAQNNDTRTDASAQKNQENSLPKDVASWRSELNGFSDQLKQKIGHEPNQTDYAKIMLSQNSSDREVLNATLEYVFHIRDRGRRDIGAFAQDAAPPMIERSNKWELFPEDPQQISADAIRQNYPDSCPFMASLIGLASSKEGRADLASMIKPQEDGTYSVYFPGDFNNPVSVGGLTKGEKMLGASSDQGYIFPAILEKAYGKYLNEQHDAGQRLPINADAARLNFDNYTEPLRLLTGDEVKSVNTRRSLDFGMNESKLHDIVSTAQKDGAIVLAGIKGAPEDRELQAMDIHKNHAYFVSGFDDKGVTLRDPVSEGAGQKKITWKQLNDNFNELIIQQKEKK